ncbi:DNA alkylation repair protein [Eleftheria terrae]|uniref:DNA alkylation repair protein n=1 Tax=Eleftheria terrae TaxID=1597781 RepID=UPI00263B49A0|nr:DNA alkylation repair protein [Eleftheria terrae]WKB50991.1 DNA alkylation repair protein [Eleftheria terrae]
MSLPTDTLPALKDGFSADTVRWIAAGLLAAHPPFDRAAFVAACLDGFDRLTLMERVARVAHAMVACLPSDYRQALDVLLRAMGPARQGPPVVEGMAAFRHAPHLQFVAEAGLDDVAASLDALERMTCHFTGEFAIRPFLEHEPQATFERLHRWCGHPEWRVRRLASEGSRPLLPWGRRVAALVEDPSRGLAVIDRLAGDEQEIVRRSAANHLNDISRLDPALAVAAAGRWLASAGPQARRTVERGLRTLVKQGHPQALALLGYASEHAVTLAGLTLDRKQLHIGQTLALCFELRHPGPQPLAACVDYAVHYQAARGAPRRKVFKGEVRELKPGVAESFGWRRDFTVRSTRKLYPGSHRIEVLVNGRCLGSAEFELV